MKTNEIDILGNEVRRYVRFEERVYNEWNGKKIR